MVQKPLQEAITFEQLALKLNLDDELEVGDGVSLEEARIRSEEARKAFETPPSPTLTSNPSPAGGRGGNEEWFEEYQYLRTAGWPWRVAAFIAWSASPKKGRNPKTQMELAQKILGLNSDRVIYTWRKKNPAIDEVIGLMQASPLFKHRRDFYEALVESASTPDYKNHQDRKLALEMTGDYIPRLKVDERRILGINDLKNLSEDELEQLIQSMDKGKKADAGEPGSANAEE